MTAERARRSDSGLSTAQAWAARRRIDPDPVAGRGRGLALSGTGRSSYAPSRRCGGVECRQGAGRLSACEAASAAEVVLAQHDLIDGLHLMVERVVLGDRCRFPDDGISGRCRSSAASYDYGRWC